MTALFARPDWGPSYFGNYFEPRFRRLRFYSWVNYHPVGAVYDPLFTYYRWQHRGEKTWERELRAVNIRRFNGEAPGRRWRWCGRSSAGPAPTRRPSRARRS